MQYITTAERIGLEKGELKKAVEAALNLLSMGVLTHTQISKATELDEKEIRKLEKPPTK